MVIINDAGVAAVSPSAVRGVDYELIDYSDGNGVQLMWLGDPAAAPDLAAIIKASAESELTAAKRAKIEEINACCRAKIVGGFSSAALGAPHTYDSEEADQLNLIGAIALNSDLPYRCTDAAGVKDFRPHTAAQLKQVAADGAAVKLSALEKAALLKASVLAVNDIAALAAIKW